MSLALLGGLPTICSPVLAHHGSASYKTDQVVVMKQVTVTKFLWANPHTMLLFDVKDEKGNIAHWAGEAGSPSAVRLLGWNKHSVQEGDVITVQLFPSKFESNVGRIDKIVLADGTTLKDSPRGIREYYPDTEGWPSYRLEFVLSGRSKRGCKIFWSSEGCRNA